MKRKCQELIWAMPKWIHGLILRIFDMRLVKTQCDETGCALDFEWVTTRQWHDRGGN